MNNTIKTTFFFFKKKLKPHGASANSHSWFGNYVSSQKKCVEIDNNVNSSEDILWGVPQGSLFGLPLITLLITNLKNVCNN